jgi:hypothetical protein
LEVDDLREDPDLVIGLANVLVEISMEHPHSWAPLAFGPCVPNASRALKTRQDIREQCKEFFKVDEPTVRVPRHLLQYLHDTSSVSDSAFLVAISSTDADEYVTAKRTGSLSHIKRPELEKILSDEPRAKSHGDWDWFYLNLDDIDPSYKVKSLWSFAYSGQGLCVWAFDAASSEWPVASRSFIPVGMKKPILIRAARHQLVLLKENNKLTIRAEPSSEDEGQSSPSQGAMSPGKRDFDLVHDFELVRDYPGPGRLLVQNVDMPVEVVGLDVGEGVKIVRYQVTDSHLVQLYARGSVEFVQQVIDPERAETGSDETPTVEWCIRHRPPEEAVVIRPKPPPGRKTSEDANNSQVVPSRGPPPKTRGPPATRGRPRGG